MSLHSNRFPSLPMEELNAARQTWDGPWLVEVRYQLAVTDTSDAKAARIARHYIEGTDLEHDESPAPIRLLHYKAKVLPYAIEPWDLDEAPDKEGV